MANPEGLDRALLELDASLTNAGMPKEDVGKTLQAMRDLNREQFRVRQQQQIREIMLRVEKLGDQKALERMLAERVDVVRRQASEASATNPDRARRLEAQAKRLTDPTLQLRTTAADSPIDAGYRTVLRPRR